MYHVDYPSDPWMVFSLSMDRNGLAMDDYTPFRRTYQPSMPVFLILAAELTTLSHG